MGSSSSSSSSVAAGVSAEAMGDVVVFAVDLDVCSAFSEIDGIVAATGSCDVVGSFSESCDVVAAKSRRSVDCLDSETSTTSVGRE